MLIEVLESAIFLETFTIVKWHCTELANVDSHTKVHGTFRYTRVFRVGEH
jgi:hypothetical protein